MSAVNWPDATLSPIARARALAAGLPGAGLAEVTIAAPFAEAWSRIMDLERSVPAADHLVTSIRVRSREVGPDGVERLRIVSRSPLGLAQKHDVTIEDGFCLMRAPGTFVVVMAAEPLPDDPGRTRYVHVESVPRRAARFLRPVMNRIVAADARGFRRFVESAGGDGGGHRPGR
jgi:hypothetical protein